MALTNVSAVLFASALGTVAIAPAAHAQNVVGAQTYTSGLDPADVDSFSVVTGFAQSFEVTVNGTLASVDIEFDLAPGATSYWQWQLWADSPDGALLHTGNLWAGPSVQPRSGTLSLGALFSDSLNIPVAIGDVLVLGIRQTNAAEVGQAAFDWWAGDAPDVYDPYDSGTGYVRDALGNYTPGELVEGFATAFDLRLAAHVTPISGPCATDGDGPILNTDTTIEVPVGTTQVTVTGGATDDNPTTSVTVGGVVATLIDPGPSFSATVPVAGPDPIVLEVIATDSCGNASTTSQVTVTFVDVCAPELEVCMGTNVGTVFYIDVVGPADEQCVIRCATGADGQSLACAAMPICAP